MSSPSEPRSNNGGEVWPYSTHLGINGPAKQLWATSFPQQRPRKVLLQPLPLLLLRHCHCCCCCHSHCHCCNRCHYCRYVELLDADANKTFPAQRNVAVQTDDQWPKESGKLATAGYKSVAIQTTPLESAWPLPTA